MLSIFVGAGILGIIVMVMERDEFPGWGPMALCVLAAVIPEGLINLFLQPNLHIVGAVVGAVCAGFAISAACGMTVKRASIAAGIYLALDSAVPYVLRLMVS